MAVQCQIVCKRNFIIPYQWGTLECVIKAAKKIDFPILVHNMKNSSITLLW